MIGRLEGTKSKMKSKVVDSVKQAKERTGGGRIDMAAIIKGGEDYKQCITVAVLWSALQTCGRGTEAGRGIRELFLWSRD